MRCVAGRAFETDGDGHLVETLPDGQRRRIPRGSAEHLGVPEANPRLGPNHTFGGSSNPELPMCGTCGKRRVSRAHYSCCSVCSDENRREKDRVASNLRAKRRRQKTERAA